MQELLRQVPGDQLLLALKGCDEPLKQKIFKNMSQRAGRNAARTTWKPRARCGSPRSRPRRRKSWQMARKLAEEGTIALGGKGEAYV